LQVGPLRVHWYGIAYMVGILMAWKYATWLTRRYQTPVQTVDFDRFINWCVMGIIVGGRLGHVCFFAPGYYLHNPIEIVMVWRGGMSFHGGLIGVAVATLWYCRTYTLNLFAFSDIMAASVPLGLLCGRIANFINAELYGRVTTLPWGVVFPGTSGEPRHPSQLYEALGEGILLFMLLHGAWGMPSLRNHPGRITGLFLLGYGVIRFAVEYVREIEWAWHLGGAVLTSGQVLSLPLIAVGALWLMRRS
jgi:phosphatidylglycerol:prolipoprotein diacylglycerol transferase